MCKKDLSFFNKSKLPLSGKNILLTATRSLAEKMAKRFKDTGANICEMSLIAIKEIDIEKITRFQNLIFIFSLLKDQKYPSISLM